MSMTLQDNMLLPCEEKFWHKRKHADAVTRECMELMNVNPGTACRWNSVSFPAATSRRPS